MREGGERGEEGKHEKGRGDGNVYEAGVKRKRERTKRDVKKGKRIETKKIIEKRWEMSLLSPAHPHDDWLQHQSVRAGDKNTSLSTG